MKNKLFSKNIFFVLLTLLISLFCFNPLETLAYEGDIRPAVEIPMAITVTERKTYAAGTRYFKTEYRGRYKYEGYLYFKEYKNGIHIYEGVLVLAAQ